MIEFEKLEVWIKAISLANTDDSMMWGFPADEQNHLSLL